MFELLYPLLFIALIIGLFSPRLVVGWLKKPTRLKVIGMYIACAVVLSMFEKVAGADTSENATPKTGVELYKAAQQQIIAREYNKAAVLLNQINPGDTIYEESKLLVAKVDSMMKVKKAEAVAEDAIRKAAEQKADRKRTIENQFSAWDGSHIKLSRLVENNMNDPDSYEHIETVYKDEGNTLLVVTKFRGANAFGGKVINSITARVDLEGNVLEVIQ